METGKSGVACEQPEPESCVKHRVRKSHARCENVSVHVHLSVHGGRLVRNS